MLVHVFFYLFAKVVFASQLCVVSNFSNFFLPCRVILSTTLGKRNHPRSAAWYAEPDEWLENRQPMLSDHAMLETWSRSSCSRTPSADGIIFSTYSVLYKYFLYKYVTICQLTNVSIFFSKPITYFDHRYIVGSYPICYYACVYSPKGVHSKHLGSQYVVKHT